MRNRLILFLAIVMALSGRLAPAGEAGHNSAKWEKEIAAFEKSDAVNPPPKGAVEFVGSSTIRLWKTLAQDFPDRSVINRGFGGSQIEDATHFAPRIIFPYAPSMVFIQAGSNDLNAGKTPGQVFADLKEFVSTVHSRLPQTKIFFISLRPTVKRWKQHEQELELNQLVKGFAQKGSELNYVETYDLSMGPNGQSRPELFGPDKLHLNAQGYKLLAERVRAAFPKKEVAVNVSKGH